MVATCTISILVDFATVGLAGSCIRQMVVGVWSQFWSIYLWILWGV